MKSSTGPEPLSVYEKECPCRVTVRSADVALTVGSSGVRTVPLPTLPPGGAGPVGGW